MSQRLVDRLSHFTQNSAQLAQECTVAADILDDVLTQITAGLDTYQFCSGVYMLAVYASCLRADQLAVYLCSAWPFMPSLSGLHAALALIRERREQQQTPPRPAGHSA